MKIDVFPHILPRRYFDRMLATAPPGMALQKRMSGIPVLTDVELRLRIMDRYEGYVQVLTLASPPLEVVAGPDRTPELARIANDEMAAIVARLPDRFPAFVASLPMNNPDAALREIDRAIGELGATGVQMLREDRDVAFVPDSAVSYFAGITRVFVVAEGKAPASSLG